MAEVLSSTMIIDVEDQQHSAKFLSQLRNLEKENTELREKHLCANKELEAAKVMISELSAKFQKLYEETNEKAKKTLLTQLKQSEEMTRFYTGLNSFDLFLGIFNALLPALIDDKRFKISLQEQFLMTLMKLRLNLSTTDLAYRFGVSRVTACRYIEKFVTVMFVRLPPVLLRFPEQKASEFTMPLSFRTNYPKCTCIIDCFETNCEMHGYLLAKISLFSKYKMHHTGKFLLAITPQGSICFISKGYGGRVSDVEIVRDCGILNLI